MNKGLEKSRLFEIEKKICPENALNFKALEATSYYIHRKNEQKKGLGSATALKKKKKKLSDA